MSIDNQVYDRLAHTWWAPTGMLHAIRAGLNPARVAYAEDVIRRDHRLTAHSLLLLDIGCGGGLLTEELARIGCRVMGMDPSSLSVQVAADHARQGGLGIDYLVARGESIPFPDATFDVVSCCDVLEHVDDLPRVIAETARVLKPGGIYIYDTINRNLVSRFVVVTFLERWTRIMPRHMHDPDRFIRPQELRTLLEKHGLLHCETIGLVPTAGLVTMARTLWDLKRGNLSYPEAAERLRLKRGRNHLVSYMGYGRKVADR